MNTEIKNHFLDNVLGFSVVSLEYYVNDILITDAVNHLHFLYSYDINIDVLNIFCLDTQETECISKYSSYSKDELEELRHIALENIVSIFVDRNIEFVNGNISKNELIDRAEQEYWDKFTDIKDNTYCNAIKQFFDGEKKKEKEKYIEIYKQADRSKNISGLLEIEYIEKRA